MKDSIIGFIRDNVIGRLLETEELTYLLEGGDLEGVYSDKISFSELTVSDNGIQFNMIVVTEEKVYAKDDKGNRSKIVKDFTGSGTFHYELSLRKSTSEITGVMRLLTSSTNDHTMEAIVYGVHDMKLEEGQLKWKEQQLMYRDMPAGEGCYRPVAFDSEIRFYKENEKLRFEYIPIYWDVDPKTMKKTLSKDKCPHFVSKEK